jgi:predicted RNase H-like nuclease
MVRVAGVDGTPGGWAILIMEADRLRIRRLAALSDLLDVASDFEIIAVDIPIGLLDTYEVGGRVCDRAARVLLDRRASSVFPAPVRPVLGATSWPDACVRSRASAPNGKAVSKQTFAILRKIREVDELLQARRELRDVVREVHPEVCFCELVGQPMVHRKGSAAGRQERRLALTRVFADVDILEKSGRDQGLPIEDIFDAAIACWSAARLANGQARSLPEDISLDATGLPMAIWV